MRKWICAIALIKINLKSKFKDNIVNGYFPPLRVSLQLDTNPLTVEQKTVQPHNEYVRGYNLGDNSYVEIAIHDND